MVKRRQKDRAENTDEDQRIYLKSITEGKELMLGLKHIYGMQNVSRWLTNGATKLLNNLVIKVSKHVTELLQKDA